MCLFNGDLNHPAVKVTVLAEHLPKESTLARKNESHALCLMTLAVIYSPCIFTGPVMTGRGRDFIL